MRNFKFLFFFLAIAASTLFTSCSKDDDNSSPSITTVKSATIAYGLAFNKSLLDMYNIVLKYYDKDGSVVSVDASTLSDVNYTVLNTELTEDSSVVCKEWKKSIKIDSLASSKTYSAGYKLVLTPKPNADFTIGSFACCYAKLIRIYITGVTTYSFPGYGDMDTKSASIYPDVPRSSASDFFSLESDIYMSQYQFTTSEYHVATLDFQ